MITAIGTTLLDWIYPPRCELCELPLEDAQVLCGPCENGLVRAHEPMCERCGEGFEGLIEGGFRCPNCQHLKFGFEFARSALFRDSAAIDLIHRLKYGRRIYLASTLGRLAGEVFTADPRFGPVVAEGWPLVPVPLHPSRERERTFNQVREIARSLAKASGLTLIHALRRVRATTTQTLLTRSERLENLKGAFAPDPRAPLPKNCGGVILLDDVFTTGSTLHECAATLKRAGVKRVVAVTVMRG